MGRVGKKFRKAQEAVGDRPHHPLTEAIEIVTKNTFANFDETVELSATFFPRPGDVVRYDGTIHR